MINVPSLVPRLIVAVLAVCLSTAGAAEEGAAQRPDQWQRAFYVEVWTAPHDGDAAGEHAEALAAFAQNAAAFASSQNWPGYPIDGEVPALETLHADAIALRDAGVVDPLLATWLLWLDDPTAAGLRDAGDAAGTMVLVGYPPAAGVAAYHAVLTNAMSRGTLDADATRAANADWADGFSTLFADGAWKPAWERAIYRMLQNHAEEFDGMALPAWLVDLPPNIRDRWLTRMTRVWLNIKVAWNHRGSGWANTVTEEGWAGFHAALGDAMADVLAAAQQHADRSEPGTAAMICLQGDGVDPWFEQATAADPLDNRPFRVARDFSMPRWGGSPEQMFSIAERAMEVGRPDTAVPDEVPSTIASMTSDGHGRWLSLNSGRVMPVIERYIALRAANPLPGQSTDVFASRAFSLAWVVGPPAEAGKVLAGLNNEPWRLSTFPTYGVDSRWAPGSAAAAADGQATMLTARVNDLVAAGDFDEAVTLLDEAEAATEDAFLKMHYRDRRRLAIWQRDYEAGETIDLIAGGLEGWRPLNGDWRTDIDGSFKADHYEGVLRNVVGLPLGDRHEIDLTIELPDDWLGPTWRAVGLSYGYEPATDIRRHTFIFLAGVGRGGVWFNDPDSRERNQLAGRGHPTPTVAMRLRRDGQDVSVWLGVPGDDFAGEPTARHTFTTPLPEGLGLSGWTQTRQPTGVIVRAMTARRLP